MCAVLFASGDKTKAADNTKNVGADYFMTGAERRLAPGFKARFKEQRMVLIFDDADHHPVG